MYCKIRSQIRFNIWLPSDYCYFLGYTTGEIQHIKFIVTKYRFVRVHDLQHQTKYGVSHSQYHIRRSYISKEMHL